MIDLQINIAVGKSKETLTMTEAKELWSRLNEIFGDKKTTEVTPLTFPQTNPNPNYTPWKPLCTYQRENLIPNPDVNANIYGPGSIPNKVITTYVRNDEGNLIKQERIHADELYTN